MTTLHKGKIEFWSIKPFLLVFINIIYHKKISISSAKILIRKLSTYVFSSFLTESCSLLLSPAGHKNISTKHADLVTSSLGQDIHGHEHSVTPYEQSV